MTSTRRLAWSMMGLAMALVLVSVIRAQDWESEVQAGRGKFRRIVFLDDTTGFIVGATADGKSGVILRTVDGGDSWVPVDLKRTRPLTAADCAKSVCVAVGEQGAVLRSRDSVRSWMALDGPTRRSLRGIAMLDGDGKSMVAVGDGGTVLRSTDGGGTWKSVKSGTNKHLRSVVFVDASVGWAVGDAGTILLTIDGGTTWDVQDSGVSYGLADVWMRDRSWGWAVGERGTVLSTTDGGATWQKQNFGERRFLSGVTFLDERRGFIVGSSGGIWETRDAGVTWTETESDTEMTIRDVVCSESYFCHAAGDGGTTLLFVAGAPGEDVTQRQGELPMNGGETTEDGASKPESDTGSGPDLIPDAFRIDSASGMVEVIVKNIGNQPTGPAPWAVRIAYRDSKGVVLGSEVRVPVADAAVLKNGDILAISVPGTADAVPVGAVQVVVAIETQDGVSELDGKNNVGVFTVPDILRPDFVVSELTSPNADGHLRAAIRNIGTRAWTGAIGISFTPKDATGAAAWGPITTQLPQSTQIDANGGLVHFDLPTSLEAGVVTVDVRIDTSHAAVELNEENVFSFPVPVAPLPDFVVTGLTTQPENGRLRATIQNNGSRAWSGALGIAFTPKNAAGQAQWGGIATQLPASTQISANGGTIAFDLSIAVNAAAKTVDVTIDNGNAAVEQDERNTFTFPVPKPDYVVEGVAADVATGELLVTCSDIAPKCDPGDSYSRGRCSAAWGYCSGAHGGSE
ncbi:hypothetical protein HYV74_05010 [Candidatus Uhrbacteria bacterium]|nr:hypothetical protein [Candidatus Uhrbacteria bacterium]